MKLNSLISSLLLGGCLQAAILLPDPSAVNVPCGSRAVLSQYLAPGASGCIVGDKEFSNFQTIPGSAELPGTWNINIFEVSSEQFIVDVARASPIILTGPFPKDFGFQYEVKVVNSNSIITTAKVSLNPGGGSSTISKTIYDMSGGILGAVLGTGTSSGITTTINLVPPSQWIRVVENIHATDGLLSSFTDVFVQSSVVPEPATYLLVGLILIGLTFRRQKK